MDIQALKIDLAKKILKSNKPTLLQKVDQLFKIENDDDWWEDLPVEIQESIIQGVREAADGNVLNHQQVVQEAREKYGY
jgi:predicted transcriptional regulator